MKTLLLLAALAVALVGCASTQSLVTNTYHTDKATAYSEVLAKVVSTPVTSGVAERTTFEVTTENRDAGIIAARHTYRDGRLTQTITFRITEAEDGLTTVTYETTATMGSPAIANRLGEAVMADLAQRFSTAN